MLAVRMLASPVRCDLLSRKLLPKGMLSMLLRRGSFTQQLPCLDFLIRLVYTRFKTSKTSSVVALLPNGLQHPRFKTPIPGKGLYMTCWKGIKDLVDPQCE